MIDARKHCHGIAYDYLKRNLPSAQTAIMLAPGVADAFAPTITKLVGALQSIAKNTCCESCREAALVAQNALAELEKP